MGNSKSKQANRAAQTRLEISHLKALRRQHILKIAVALTIMTLLIVGKTTLEMNGILEMGNVIVGGAMMLSALCLAAFAGSAGVNFAKDGRSIKELQSRLGSA